MPPSFIHIIITDSNKGQHNRVYISYPTAYPTFATGHTITLRFITNYHHWKIRRLIIYAELPVSYTATTMLMTLISSDYYITIYTYAVSILSIMHVYLRILTHPTIGILTLIVTLRA